MTQEYEIRPAAPLPPNRAGRPSSAFLRTIANLEVGQSFVVPLHGISVGKMQKIASSRAHSWAKHHGNVRKFATRREVDGIAVWRVK